MSDPPFNLDMGKMKDPAFRAKMMGKVNSMAKLYLYYLVLKKCDFLADYNVYQIV